MTLYILKYNNYYNRLVKSENSIEDYNPYITYTLPTTNFNPADGVNTTHILGVGEYDGTGDYLIAVDDNEIISRWFIIDSVRTRSGQYQLTLHRDLVVDYYNIIKQSPCFIEKAIAPENDSAIFNTENITFNRIKTKETLLKDKTGISWLVAYLARDKAMDGSVIENKPLTGEVVQSDIANLTSNVTKSEWEAANTAIAADLNNIKFNFNFYDKVGYNPAQFLQVNLYQQNTDSTPSASFNKNTQSAYIASSAAIKMTGEQFNNKYKDTYRTILGYIPTAANINIQNADTYDQLNNLIITFANDRNQLYKIKVNRIPRTHTSPQIGTVNSGDVMYNKVQSVWSDILPTNPQAASGMGRFYSYSFSYTEVSLSLVPAGTVDSIKYNIPINRVSLNDAPYDMICAPYENISIRINNTVVESTTEQVLAVFNDLAIKYAGESAIVYDIQRVPYCPILTLESVDGVLETFNYNSSSQLFPITITKNNVDTPISAIFACQESNFYKPIVLEEPVVITNTKMQSLCDMYRLCSPNYNGVFEFDAAMNGGLTGFKVYCTYKPFNPYIQVAPIFGRLYGTNYDDSRGLICGGEWSMPIITNAWATYERQNANYLNTFNRQIENLKVQHDVQKEQEIWSVMTGALSGVAAGAFAGNAWAPGTSWGAAGGVAGGLASAIGGIRDIQLNTRLRNEAIDYAQDQFGYSLGNIKALPNTLARVSAFTINNKIFPFLEYYTCTEEEKIALANKIAYNGMSIGRIGKLEDYIYNIWSYKDIVANNYIKGKLIRLDIFEDNHVANSIANELNQGLFFKRS